MYKGAAKKIFGAAFSFKKKLIWVSSKQDEATLNGQSDHRRLVIKAAHSVLQSIEKGFIRVSIEVSLTHVRYERKSLWTRVVPGEDRSTLFPRLQLFVTFCSVEPLHCALWLSSEISPAQSPRSFDVSLLFTYGLDARFLEVSRALFFDTGPPSIY